MILRGTFILKNDKTIEDELNGQITELSGRFEIRESGITGKWQEVIDTSISVAESEKSVATMIGDFQITAEHLTADFSKTVETATTDATGAINTAKESALSSFELTAEELTTDFSKTVQTATTDATGQITKASETATSSLNRTAEELTDSFEKSFTDANGEITKQIKTQVTQNAQQWKVEVMGADADGNPNSVLAAINADESGVQISGDKIQITGELLASIIKTYGLNVADNFLVDNIGRVMCSNIYTAKEGQRIAITHDGPRIKIYSEKNILLMEICASAFEDGEDNTYIKMHDSKNYNKWIKHTPGGCVINETIADGTTYQTLIGAGYIKLLKNGFERWSQDIR